MKWATQAEIFETKEKGEVDDVHLPQFTINWSFTAKFNLFEAREGEGCTFILGRDILQGIDLDVEKLVQTQQHLDDEQRDKLKKLLNLKLALFKGERGNWKGKPMEV